MPLTTNNKILFFSVILVIGLSAIIIFWLEIHYIKAFTNRTPLFLNNSIHLPQDLSGSGPIRVINFWDPSCPCNKGNQKHLLQLVKHLAPLGIKFYSVQKPHTQGKLPKSISSRLTPLKHFPGRAEIPVSPAVGIWNKEGELVYFGTYSASLICNSSNSFVEPVLEALIQGKSIQESNGVAEGCFCDW